MESLNVFVAKNGYVVKNTYDGNFIFVAYTLEEVKKLLQKHLQPINDK